MSDEALQHDGQPRIFAPRFSLKEAELIERQAHHDHPANRHLPRLWSPFLGHAEKCRIRTVHIGGHSRTPDPDDLTGWMDEASMLAYAQRRKYPATSPQLKRWRREGLIPRPKQVHEAGRRGSRSYYPPGTRDQLIALCRLHQQRKKIEELRFRLWWDGFEIDRVAVRGTIRAAVERHLGSMNELFEGPDWVEKIEELVRVRRHPLVRFIYRAVGRDEQATIAVLTTMFTAMSGEEPEWHVPDDPEGPALGPVVVKGIGLERAADRIHDLGPIRDTVPQAAELFAWVTRGKGILRLRSILDDCSDYQLAQAREDAHIFADDMPEVVAALEKVFGRRAFGLGAFRLLRSKPFQTVEWRASFVVLLLLLRELEPSSSFDMVERAIKQAAPQARAFLALNTRRPREGSV